MPFNLPATLVPLYALLNSRLLLPSVAVVRIVHSYHVPDTRIRFIPAARHPLS